MLRSALCGFFFFQAEDGIRDLTVTGVQTCALPILLNAFSLRLGRYAQRVLTKRGVAVRTGALVKSANGHSVTLSDGTAIACATIIWSAGGRPNDPVGEAPLPRFRNARIEVDPWMRIPGAPGAWAWDYVRRDRPTRFILAPGAAPKRV